MIAQCVDCLAPVIPGGGGVVRNGQVLCIYCKDMAFGEQIAQSWRAQSEALAGQGLDTERQGAAKKFGKAFSR